MTRSRKERSALTYDNLAGIATLDRRVDVVLCHGGERHRPARHWCEGRRSGIVLRLLQKVFFSKKKLIPPVSDSRLSQSDAELRSHVVRVLDTQYEVEKEIGRGGMGIVYKGRDKRLKRAVAIMSSAC